jgi:hypothetical protein
VAVEVVLTRLADTQRKKLRATPAKKFDQWLEQLKQHGCAALGYRLTGEVLERLCVRHIYRRWRVVVAFEHANRVAVLLIGEHTDDDPGIDVYTQLYALAELPVPTGHRTKPPCCSDEGEPPDWDEDIEHLVSRAHEVAKTRRRARAARQPSPVS